MLECSIGNIDEVIVRKALSGYTFAELVVPMASYTDSPKFNVSIDNVKKDYTMVGSEVYMHVGEKTQVKISAMLESQAKWLNMQPSSVESAEIEGILKGLGLENGPKTPITLLNLFLADGQLAILLANMSPKLAFVDFEKNKVLYYNDLYKQKPIAINVPFRRLYGRAPIAGFIGWENLVTGSYPDDAQAILPFGQFTNLDQSSMENVVNNCNDISKLFTDMQIFTYSQELELGTTVMSQLTYDKRVVVAAEMHYDKNSNLQAVYYCV